MDKLIFAKQKLAQIKAEISRVRTSDFHHPGAKRALDTIERNIFDRLFFRIENTPPSASVEYLDELIFTANVYVSHFHQIIGIVLRSTNARNSFEVYDPLLRLAKSLLGRDTALILSSEWEFIPFTMPSVFGGVPNCTVVGLPAMEAGNALLTPLAGHELGHAVWRSRKLDDLTEQSRKDALCDIFLESWEAFKQYGRVQNEIEMRSRLEARQWDLLPLGMTENPLDVMGKVCEELFCDMLGVRLFGMGYLYAFEYLAAPSLGATDLQEYPAFDARARYLADAMNGLDGVAAGRQPAEESCARDERREPPWPRLEGYALRFTEDPAEDNFLLESAHRACERLVPELRRMAAEVCESPEDALAAIPSPSFDRASDALERFKKGLPAIGNLADMINAGWLGYLDSNLWSDKFSWKKKKFRFLNELVFKSLDVTEFDERGREHALEVGQAG